MNARYNSKDDSTSDVLVAPRDKTPKQQVKSKFKELLAKNKKKQCNYEEVHALYKTQKKPKPNTAPSSSDEQAPVKKPPVPRFTRDNFFISRPAVPMIEQFYERHIKDNAIIAKGIAEGKFVQGTLYFDKTLSNKWDGYVDVPGLP